jgi:hypothetical protein
MNNTRALLVVIAALALICGYLAVQVVNQTDAIETIEESNSNLELEKETLLFDLEKMRFSYDTLKTENSMMISEIADQRAQIDELMSRVKNSNWSLSKARKEAETLRTIMQGYVATIDSLNQLNVALIRENEQMRGQVENVEKRNRDLRERQDNMEEIISTGQVLQAAEIQAVGLRILGSGKQRETTRASRTDMIRLCFTLLENRIAEPGNKTLHLQVLSSDGAVLQPGTGIAPNTPSGTPVSATRIIDYAKERLDACIFFTPPAQLMEGVYLLRLLEGDQIIGEADIELN